MEATLTLASEVQVGDRIRWITAANHEAEVIGLGIDSRGRTHVDLRFDVGQGFGLTEDTVVWLPGTHLYIIRSTEAQACPCCYETDGHLKSCQA